LRTHVHVCEQMPTLIVHGEHDGTGEPNHLLLSMPDRNVLILPNATHAAYLGQPEEFVTAVINFVNYVNARTLVPGHVCAVCIVHFAVTTHLSVYTRLHKRHAYHQRYKRSRLNNHWPCRDQSKQSPRSP
jgi:hypothetical protein